MRRKIWDLRRVEKNYCADGREYGDWSHHSKGHGPALIKAGSEGVDRMYFGMKNMNISYGELIEMRNID